MSRVGIDHNPQIKRRKRGSSTGGLLLLTQRELERSVSKANVASRRLTWVLRGLAAALLVGLVGYLSNSVSAEHCEETTARGIVTHIGQRDVFVLPDDGRSWFPQYPDSEQILRRVGLTMRLCAQTGLATGACFPWVGVARARSVGPYILEVEWGFVGSPLGGHRGRSRFLAVFGFIAFRQDRVGWAT